METRVAVISIIVEQEDAIEELNIYYVAATRAKKAIKMADLELQYNSNE